MSNPFFDDYDRPARNTLIRASAVIAIFDAIIAGFDLVPSPTNLSDYCTCTGPANVYALTSVGTVTSYAAGLRVAFIASATNTGSSTINVNSIGAAALKRQDLTDLHAGDIPSGAMVIAMHDGTRFQLVSMAVADVAAAAASASAASTSASAAASSAVAAAASAAAAAASAASAGIATIADGTVGAPGLKFASDTDNGLYRIGTNNWAASAGGVKAWEVDASARFIVPTKIGIGMTPTNILDITQTGNSGALIALSNANSGTGAYAGLALSPDTGGMSLQAFSSGYTSGTDQFQGGTLLSATGAGGLTLSCHSSAPIRFWTNFTQRMILDANGNLLLGNTVQLVSEKLLVRQSAAASYVMIADNSHATPAASAIIRANYSGSAPNDTTAVFFYGTDSSTTRYIVYSNGNVVNTNNSYGAISAREVKQDIAAAPDHWDTAKALAANLVTYRLKSDVAKMGDAAPTLLGGIAEDWEGIAPELVSVDGNSGLKSINYMGALIRGLAAQGKMMERIEALEAKAGIG